MYSTQSRDWMLIFFETQVNSVSKRKHFPRKKEISVALTNGGVKLENSEQSALSPLLSANVK